MASIKDFSKKKDAVSATKNRPIVGIPAPIVLQPDEQKIEKDPIQPEATETLVTVPEINDIAAEQESSVTPEHNEAKALNAANNIDLFNALLSNAQTYNNGRQTVIIDMRLKEKLDIFARYADCNISRIMNNMLYLLLESDTQYNISAEIAKLINKQQANITKQFK